MLNPLLRPYGRDWHDGASLVNGPIAYHQRLAALESTAFYKQKIVSPPDDYCFFNSLMQFVKFDKNVSFEQKQTQFMELSTYILLVAGKTTQGFLLSTICSILKINFLSIDKLETISKSGAQAKYNLKRPTLVYHSIEAYGHVGFLSRQSGIQKLYWKQVMKALQQVFHKKQNENVIKMDSISNVLPKKKFVQKLNAVESSTKQPKQMSNGIKYFMALFKASKKFNHLPRYTSTMQEERYHSLIVMQKSLKAGVNFDCYTFTSQMSIIIASKCYKDAFPHLWQFSQVKEIACYSFNETTKQAKVKFGVTNNQNKQQQTKTDNCCLAFSLLLLTTCFFIWKFCSAALLNMAAAPQKFLDLKQYYFGQAKYSWVTGDEFMDLYQNYSQVFQKFWVVRYADLSEISRIFQFLFVVLHIRTAHKYNKNPPKLSLFSVVAVFLIIFFSISIYTEVDFSMAFLQNVQDQTVLIRFLIVIFLWLVVQMTLYIFSSGTRLFFFAAVVFFLANYIDFKFLFASAIPIPIQIEQTNYYIQQLKSFGQILYENRARFYALQENKDFVRDLIKYYYLQTSNFVYLINSYLGYFHWLKYCFRLTTFFGRHILIFLFNHLGIVFNFYFVYYKWYVRTIHAINHVINIYNTYFVNPCPKIINYKKKPIIKAAIERNSIAHILSIHCQNIPKQVQEVKNSSAGLMVERKNFKKSVISRLTGFIQKDFNNVLMNYGQGFTAKQISESPHTSGGHPHLRAVVDSLQANCLSRIFRQATQINVKNLRDGVPKQIFHIVDSGAKFSKIGKLISEMCTIKFSDMFGNIKDDCPAQIRPRVVRAIQDCRTAFNAIAWNGQNLMNDLQTLLTVQLVVVHVINGVNVQIDVGLGVYTYMISKEQLHELLAVHNCFIYHPIRPRVQQYDVNYYEKQLQKYQQLSMEADLRVNLQMPFQGKVQDWQITFNPNLNDSVFYLLFDVHYYLQNWKPRNLGRVLLVGGAFVHDKGEYRLPMCQGSYMNYSTQKNLMSMKMYTSSSGTSYVHPLVQVPQVDLRIDYGWYAHIMHDCSSQTLSILRVKTPLQSKVSDRISHSSNQQAVWICAEIEKFDPKEIKSLKHTYDVYKPFAKVVDKMLIERNVQILKDYVLNTHNFDIEPVVTIREFNYTIVNYFFVLIKVLMSRIQPVCMVLEYFNESPFVYIFLQFIKRVSFYTDHLVSRVDISSNIPKKSFTKNQLFSKDLDHDSFENLEEIQRQNINKNQDFKIRFGTTNFQQRNICRSQNDKYINRQQFQELARLDVIGEKTKLKLPIIHQDLVQTQKRQAFFIKPTEKVTYVSNNYISTTFVQAREQSNKTVDQVNDWMTRYKTQITNSKCQLLPFEQLQTTTCTGLSMANGSYEYQWSSKSVLNAIHALYKRHLLPELKVDANHLARFSRTTSRYFKHLSPVLNQNLRDLEFDPIAIIKNKDYQDGKKMKYYINTLNQLNGVSGMKGSFMTMVKSGQVNYANQDVIRGNVVQNVLYQMSSRPRNIMTPSESLCGILTIFQTILWPAIKKAERGFCQGLTKQQLKQIIKYRKSAGWKQISLDGSGFDSSQFSCLMKVVDDLFWKTIQPSIRQIFSRLHHQRPQMMRVNPKDFCDSMMEALCIEDNICFTRVPDIRYRQWPQEIKAAWKRDFAASFFNGNDMHFIQSNYIYNVIKGTTFSGHPTKTTLGNTWRSLCYAYYYLQLAGFRDAWNDSRFYVVASGDDVVIFIHDLKTTQKVGQVILQNSSRKKVLRPQQLAIGLGQCIEKISIGQWYHMDFCSKWAFGDGIGFDLSRDVLKTLTTKQYYSKQNKNILKYPGLHAYAIYQGIKSQGISHLLQDLLLVRSKFYSVPQKVLATANLSKLSDIYRIPFVGQKYAFQNQINIKCDLSIATLIHAIQTRQLNHVNFGTTAYFTSNHSQKSEFKFDQFLIERIFAKTLSFESKSCKRSISNELKYCNIQLLTNSTKQVFKKSQNYNIQSIRNYLEVSCQHLCFTKNTCLLLRSRDRNRLNLHSCQILLGY